MATKPQSMQQHRERMLAQKAARLQRSPDPRRLAVAAAVAASAPAIAAVANTLAATLQAQGGLPVVNSSIATTTDPSIVLGDIPSPVQNIELRLSSHLQQLKSIKSVRAKEALKAEWLPEYQGFIDGTLANEAHGQNNALMHLMVWAIDAGNYALAVRIGQYAILNNMVMPEPYSRSVAEILAENCAEAFIKDQALAVANTALIHQLIEVIRGEDVVDQIYAKVYKALGIALHESQPVDALNAYKIALRMDDNSGVKKIIERLESQIKRNATGSAPDTSGSQEVASASADLAAHPASTASSDTTPSEPDSGSAGA